MGFAIAALAIVLLAALMFQRRHQKRPTAQEIERRRRELIYLIGKIGDGEVVDIEGNAIIYSYSVAGVGYTASQDLTALESLLPADPAAMIGPVAVKFNRENPADSIILCEHWSGLRIPA